MIRLKIVFAIPSSSRRQTGRAAQSSRPVAGIPRKCCVLETSRRREGMFGGSHDPESLRIESPREAIVTATTSTCRNRDGAIWIEVLLLSPVIGLALLGVLEMRHALNVEACLARAANRVAEAGPDAVAFERLAVSAALNVAE